MGGNTRLLAGAVPAFGRNKRKTSGRGDFSSLKKERKTLGSVGNAPCSNDGFMV
jgi:hypothetical protein